MATFTDLVRAQKQSGKSAFTSLSGAYNQMNMQRFDPRNALFSRSGLMTALFPSLKGYQASPVSSKNVTSNVSSLAQQGVSDSPTVLKSIARDSRTSARNSMALPSIARNMAQIVRIWGGTPAKYFEGAKQKEEQYETKFGTGKKSLPGLGKTSAGGGFNIMSLLGSIGKGVGGIFSGIGSIAGSLVGGAASIVSSIFSGIGSLVGGAFSGVFGVLGGALSRMGFIGIILAGVVGFALYSLSKSLDFSSLGKGIGSSFESIKKALTKLYDDVDDASDGKLSGFFNSIKKQFQLVTFRIASALETAVEVMMKLGGAVLKDFAGYFQNFFEENKGKIYALMAIGIMGPRAFLTLPGATITAIAAAVGNATGEYDLDTLKQIKEAKKRELEDFKKTGKMNLPADIEGYQIPSKAEYENKLKKEIADLEEKEKTKAGRTTNFKSVMDELSIEGISRQYDEGVQRRMRESGSPTPAGSSTDGPLSGAPLLDLIGKAEGGSAGYDAANKGTAGNLPKGYPGLSKLTVGEVMDLQARKEIFAAGRYQIIPETLAKLVASKIVKREDQFSPVIQDKLAMELINRRLAKAGSDPIEQQLELSKEFAAIAVPRDVKNNKGRLVKEGQSFYEGQGGNRASISTATMQKALTGKTPEQRLADNRNAPTPERTADASDEKKSFTMDSVGKSVADFARDQLITLDKLTGGQLMKGSTELADMLRDVTNELYKELMNNPTLVDNSQKVVNNNVNSGGGGSPTTASAYNSETLRDLLNLQTR